jgi:hypothetical protein
VGFVDLISPVDLEGEMLDSDLVIMVGSAVGGSNSEHRAAPRVFEVHDLFRTSISRIPDYLDPTQRPEQVEIEAERALNVGDGKVDVVYSSRWHDPAALRLRLRKPGGFEGFGLAEQNLPPDGLLIAPLGDYPLGLLHWGVASHAATVLA